MGGLHFLGLQGAYSCGVRVYEVWARVSALTLGTDVRRRLEVATTAQVASIQGLLSLA